jgi:hypothetical protein
MFSGGKFVCLPTYNASNRTFRLFTAINAVTASEINKNINPKSSSLQVKKIFRRRIDNYLSSIIEIRCLQQMRPKNTRVSNHRQHRRLTRHAEIECDMKPLSRNGISTCVNSFQKSSAVNFPTKVQETAALPILQTADDMCIDSTPEAFHTCSTLKLSDFDHEEYQLNVKGCHECLSLPILWFAYEY